MCYSIKLLEMHKFHKLQEKISHLIYMNDIKFFAKMMKNCKPNIGGGDI